MSGVMTNVTLRSTMPFWPRSVHVSLITAAGAVLAGSDQRLTFDGWAKIATGSAKNSKRFERRCIYTILAGRGLLNKLRSIAPKSLVARHPVAVQDRAHQRRLACQDRRSANFCELVRLADAVAAQHFEALPLSCKASAAAVGGNDQRRKRDRPIEI